MEVINLKTIALHTAEWKQYSELDVLPDVITKYTHNTLVAFGIWTNCDGCHFLWMII